MKEHTPYSAGRYVALGTVAFAALSLATTAVCAVLLIRFAVPLNDDFARAYLAREHGWLPNALNLYREWFGRWLAASLESLVLGLLDPFESYPWLLSALAATQLVILRLVCGALCPRGRPAQLWAMSIFTWLVIWAASPHVSEYYYWVCGAVEYSLSVSLGIGAISAGVLASRYSGALAALAGGLAGVGLFLVGGLHELTSATCCLAAAGGVALAPPRSRVRQLWVALLACSMLGLLSNLLAPGNQLRPGRELAHPSAGAFFRAVAWDVLNEVIAWLQDLKLWSATALLVCSFALERAPSWNPAPAKLRAVAPLLTLAAAGLWMLAPAAALGWSMNPRSANACYVICFLGWVTTIWAWAAEIRRWFGAIPASVPRAGALLALGVLGLSLLITGNTLTSAIALTKNIPGWHAAQLALHQQAEGLARRGESQITLPAPPRSPPTYMVSDLKSDPAGSTNRAFAGFHGLVSVSALDATEAAERCPE